MLKPKYFLLETKSQDMETDRRRLGDGFSGPGGLLRIRRLWRSFRWAHDGTSTPPSQQDAYEMFRTFLKIFWLTHIDCLTLSRGFSTTSSCFFQITQIPLTLERSNFFPFPTSQFRTNFATTNKNLVAKGGVEDGLSKH